MGSPEPQALSNLPVRVAAAVIRREDGAVLLGLRPRDRHQGGLWEFPGGKFERRERQIDALARELREELGIAIARALPLIRLVHHYPDKAVDLEVLEVEEWSGEPAGREGQQISWVAPSELGMYTFPDANVPITRAAMLPRIGLVTPATTDDATAFLARLERCLDGGVGLVRLRLQITEAQVTRSVHRDAAVLCERYDARLVIEGRPGDALLAGAHGLHLDARRLLQLSERPLGADYLVSASCHTLADVRQAERLGIDFCFVSPVHDLRPGPGARALGWHGLRKIVKHAVVPVYALGGMRAADARMALRAGCQGIAMTHGVWEHEDPAGVIDAAKSASLAAAYTVDRGAG